MRIIDADRLKGDVLLFSPLVGVIYQIIEEQPTVYNNDDIERAILLLGKVLELLDRQDESIYVLNLLEELVFYDGVECDGYCLKNDIECLLSVLRGEQE